MTDASTPTIALPDSPAALGRLVARERVRAMESLASLIAHEIRSAVLGVTSAAQLLRYALPQDPVAEKSLGRILLESERLSSLHEALSEYATEVPPRFAPMDPDGLWRTVLANMRGALEANSVSVESVVAADAWRSTISVAGSSRPSSKQASGDFERPTVLVALANRTLVAHGGEVVTCVGEDEPLVAAVRLPLSSSVE